MDYSSFLQRYVAYNSGNECPRNYHIWSGLVALAATTQRKVYLSHGYFDIHPNLYVCLVGKQGARKSTAKDIARDLLTTTFPDLPMSASVQSREDIIKFMSSDECLFSYTNEEGALVELRPYNLFLNELKNFLSFNPGGTIEFLTDIYDRRVFSSSTLSRGTETIINPCINILACETPDWIIDKLKSRVISGGFTRRMIYVYETAEGPKISFPKLPEDGKELLQWMQDHLKKVAKIVGPFQWGPGARTFYDVWYQSLQAPEDDIMEGYYRSKHIQALKVAMLNALAEDEPKLVITPELLKISISMLDAIETNMPKLSAAAGRNELAYPILKVIEAMERHGEKLYTPREIKLLLSRDFNPFEQVAAMRSMVDCAQIVSVTMKGVQLYTTRANYAEMKARGEV